jgi:hypothetical protein
MVHPQTSPKMAHYYNEIFPRWDDPRILQVDGDLKNEKSIGKTMPCLQSPSRHHKYIYVYIYICGIDLPFPFLGG